MTHNEAWHFCQLGRHLERADKTSRILDVKYFLLLPNAADIGTTYDDIQWAAVLRSASAFEMYRKTSRADLARSGSWSFCCSSASSRARFSGASMPARESVHAISGTPAGMFRHPVERLFGELCSELAYARVEAIIAAGLHEYLDRCRPESIRSATRFPTRSSPRGARRASARKRVDEGLPLRSSCNACDAGLFDDAHIDIHAAERRGRTDERAPQRQRVPLVPRHSHANQVAIPHDAVGGIEIDPAGSRQVRLHPAVRGSTTDGGGSASPSGTKM